MDKKEDYGAYYTPIKGGDSFLRIIMYLAILRYFAIWIYCISQFGLKGIAIAFVVWIIYVVCDFIGLMFMALPLRYSGNSKVKIGLCYLAAIIMLPIFIAFSPVFAMIGYVLAAG